MGWDGCVVNFVWGELGGGVERGNVVFFVRGGGEGKRERRGESEGKGGKERVGRKRGEGGRKREEKKSGESYLERKGLICGDDDDGDLVRDMKGMRLNVWFGFWEWMWWRLLGENGVEGG